MKLIIAGSRSLSPSINEISELVKKFNIGPVTEVVSGAARGVDTAGERWARAHGITVTRYKPNWRLFRKVAPSIRNGEMAEYGDALLLIWNGCSSGSADMKRQMLSMQKPIHEVVIRN